MQRIRNSIDLQFTIESSKLFSSETLISDRYVYSRSSISNRVCFLSWLNYELRLALTERTCNRMIFLHCVLPLLVRFFHRVEKKRTAMLEKRNKSADRPSIFMKHVSPSRCEDVIQNVQPLTIGILRNCRPWINKYSMCARTSPRGVSRFRESSPSISEAIHDATRRD